jgi:hypothetical protein
VQYCEDGQEGKREGALFDSTWCSLLEVRVVRVGEEASMVRQPSKAHKPRSQPFVRFVWKVLMLEQLERTCMQIKLSHSYSHTWIKTRRMDSVPTCKVTPAFLTTIETFLCHHNNQVIMLALLTITSTCMAILTTKQISSGGSRFVPSLICLL